MGNATVAGSARTRAESSNLGAAQLSRQHVGDGAEEIRPLDEVAVDDVVTSAPWRTFRWYGGQQHYSGTYWAATESDHVIYESRLELARLLFADFDVGVQRIAAQPFLLRCPVDGKERRHIPDYDWWPSRYGNSRWADPLLFGAAALLILAVVGVVWAVRTLYVIGADRRWSWWILSAPAVYSPPPPR